jgi:hypothetical protein
VLTIPAGVTTIRDFTFLNCSGLTGALTIPAGVTTIGSYAFGDCSGLTGALTIPSSVTSIGSYAFENCRGFTGALTIGAGVTSIGMGTFRGCIGLTGTLNIPSSVTSIGVYAFYNCSSFTGSLTIPEGVKTIGESAFYNCRGLTGALTIPSGVTSIGNSAFYNCSGFTTVINLATTPQTINVTTFNTSVAGKSLFVPAEALSEYKTAAIWSTFGTKIGLANKPTTVAFEYNGSEQGIANVAYMVSSGVGESTITGNYTATVTLNSEYLWDDKTTGDITVNWSIAPKQLTWNTGTVNSKTYDGTTSATINTSPLNGVVAGDVVTLTGGMVAFANANANTSAAVTVSGIWGISGAAAGNYIVPAGQPTFSAAAINKKPLTWNAAGTVNSKEYDGTTTATINVRPTLSGIIGSDVVTLTNGTVAFANANANTSVAVTVSGTWGLGGAAAGNYIAPTAQPTFSNGVITQREATLAWAGYTDLVYNTQPQTVTATVSNLVATDVCNVTVTGNTATNAGSYTATATALSNANYKLPAAATLAYTIAKAPVGEFVAPDAISVTYTPTLKLSDLTLPAGYVWDKPSTVLNAGNNQSFKAIIPAPTIDDDNYEPASGLVTVNVAKAAGSFDLHSAVNVTYSTALTLGSLPLPAGYSWNAPTTVLTAGSGQTFAATFTDPSGNYNAASGSITVNVAKAAPAYTAPTGLTAKVGQELSTVTLTGGWSWMTPTTLVGAAGNQTHKAKFTPTDVANYNVVENVDVVIAVSTADANPMKDFKKSDGRFGIMLSSSVVSDKVEMTVKLENNERVVEANVVVYDAVGNVVFEATTREDKVVWNLTNSAGRNVANGSYLIVAEVTSANKKIYAYSAKLGVRR